MASPQPPLRRGPAPGRSLLPPREETARPPALASLFSNLECQIVDAGRYRFPAAWRLDERGVPHYRLFVCLDGGADFAVDGDAYSLPPGGLLLVPPGAPHSALHDPRAPLFAAYLIEFTARAFGVLDLPAVCGLPVLLLPGPDRRPKFPASAFSLTHHFLDHPPGYELVLHTHCVRLLSLMWSESLDQAGAVGGEVRPLDRLLPVLQAIERRYAEPLDVPSLAALVPLHPTYFCTVFKQTTGYSPLRYVAKRRLEHACALLTATELPLEEIAARTGFYDAAHLIRVFRRATGTSPGRYRRSEARPIGADAGTAPPGDSDRRMSPATA